MIDDSVTLATMLDPNWWTMTRMFWAVVILLVVRVIWR